MFSIGKIPPSPKSRTFASAGTSCVVVTRTFTQFDLVKQELVCDQMPQHLQNFRLVATGTWKTVITAQMHNDMIFPTMYAMKITSSGM
jgi:hypothetical protein